MPREIAGGTSMVPPRILMRLGRVSATKGVWRRQIQGRQLNAPAHLGCRPAKTTAFMS
jgi:hypothetical protein